MTDDKYYKICYTINIIIIAVAVILAVVSFFVLPDRVMSTFGSKGSAETLSKMEAIAIPLLITGVGEAIFFSRKDFRAVLVSALGIAGFILNFVCN